MQKCAEQYALPSEMRHASSKAHSLASSHHWKCSLRYLPRIELIVAEVLHPIELVELNQIGVWL